MSPSVQLSAFAEQVGFEVSYEADVVRAIRVPCLLKDGVEGTCVIEKSFDPSSRVPNDRLGGAVHAVRITTSPAIDGRVYQADSTPIGNYINGDKTMWSNISIKKGGQGQPEDDESASETVHRYAKHIVGAVWARKEHVVVAEPLLNPFQIPNSFEDRAALHPVQDRIRGQSVAILGLGGTGSYVLDLLSKTPLNEIHLIDGDKVEWHNLFRAPGAPSAEEIEAVRRGDLLKVDYYSSKYGSFRDGIRPHSVRVESAAQWREFLLLHPIDFAFVCIDQSPNSDSPRQDVVYQALSDTQVPFVDSGVSISVVDGAVGGSVTTSAYEAGSEQWTAIPNARVTGDQPGYRNVQLPEVNALAAALAVMEWRRRTGQYVSESKSFLHKFRIEVPKIKIVPCPSIEEEHAP